MKSSIHLVFYLTLIFVSACTSPYSEKTDMDTSSLLLPIDADIQKLINTNKDDLDKWETKYIVPYKRNTLIKIDDSDKDYTITHYWKFNDIAIISAYIKYNVKTTKILILLPKQLSQSNASNIMKYLNVKHDSIERDESDSNTYYACQKGKRILKIKYNSVIHPVIAEIFLKKEY